MEVADSDGCAVLLLVKLVLADDMNRRERRENGSVQAAAGQAGTPLVLSGGGGIFDCLGGEGDMVRIMCRIVAVAVVVV